MLSNMIYAHVSFYFLLFFFFFFFVVNQTINRSLSALADVISVLKKLVQIK
jgi:hypothetical protein